MRQERISRGKPISLKKKIEKTHNAKCCGSYNGKIVEIIISTE